MTSGTDPSGWPHIRHGSDPEYRRFQVCRETLIQRGRPTRDRKPSSWVGLDYYGKDGLAPGRTNSGWME